MGQPHLKTVEAFDCTRHRAYTRTYNEPYITAVKLIAFIDRMRLDRVASYRVRRRSRVGRLGATQALYLFRYSSLFAVFSRASIFKGIRTQRGASACD